MIRVRFIAANRCPTTNPAEVMIDTGRIAKLLRRHGATMDEVCAFLGCPAEHVALALDYFTASDGHKFRALVENWSAPRIAQVLQGRHAPTAATGCEALPDTA